MKRGMILFSIAAMLAVLARCQTAMIALDDIPGTTPVCVTNYGPQVVSLTAWFAGLQSRTSYWDTAYSWGDWHSAVAQKLDITSTNGWETGSHAAFLTAEADTNALAAIAALKVKMRWDMSDANVYDTLEGGTNWVVYRIENVQTNYSITYSEGFRFDDGMGTVFYPPITNSIVFPNTTGSYHYYLTVRAEDPIPVVEIIGGGVWMSYDEDWPQILINSGEFYHGTATVSRVIVYPTQEVYRVDIPALTNIAAVIESLRAAVTNHTANGDIGSDAHLVTGDRALIDSVPSLATTNALAAAVAAKEIHADSFTNLLWKSVFSNGWHWLIAYTNTP